MVGSSSPCPTPTGVSSLAGNPRLSQVRRGVPVLDTGRALPHERGERGDPMLLVPFLARGPQEEGAAKVRTDGRKTSCPKRSLKTVETPDPLFRL